MSPPSLTVRYSGGEDVMSNVWTTEAVPRISKSGLMLKKYLIRVRCEMWRLFFKSQEENELELMGRCDSLVFGSATTIDATLWSHMCHFMFSSLKRTTINGWRIFSLSKTHLYFCPFIICLINNQIFGATLVSCRSLARMETEWNRTGVWGRVTRKTGFNLEIYSSHKSGINRLSE